MNRKIFRVAGLIAVGVLATSSLAACGTPAAPDYLLVRYDKKVNGGGLSFKQCVQPSKKAGSTYNDQNFAMPVSLRTWNIRPEGGDTATPVQTGTKRRSVPGDKVGATQPGPDVNVYTKTEFYLNTDCGKANAEGLSTDKNSPIVRFWENTGRRYGVAGEGESAFSDEGWKRMLLNTLVPAEEKAVRSSSRNFDADDLDGNTSGVWAQMEQQMANAFIAELQASIGGGDYFCGPQYRRDPVTGQPMIVTWNETAPDPSKPGQFIQVPKSGTCPPVRISITDVSFSDSGVAAARAKVSAAQLNKQAADIDAQSKVDVANKLKEAGAEGAAVQAQQNDLLKEQEHTKQVEACAKNPNCTVIVGNAGVNVGAK